MLSRSLPAPLSLARSSQSLRNATREHHRRRRCSASQIAHIAKKKVADSPKGERQPIRKANSWNSTEFPGKSKHYSPQKMAVFKFLPIFYDQFSLFINRVMEFYMYIDLTSGSPLNKFDKSHARQKVSTSYSVKHSKFHNIDE